MRYRPRWANYVRQADRILFIAGLLCLTAFFWVTAERAWLQWRYQRQFDRGSAGAGSASPKSPQGLRPGPLAKIEIPRVGISAVILDGVDGKTLRQAVGHVPGTAYPGDGGNVVLAAHRDSFFRNLRFIRRGDTVRLITRDGAETYYVESTDIVDPGKAEVLAPTSEPLLTLLTCYPFHFVGSAPERFVVQARPVSGRRQSYASDVTAQ